MGSAELRVSSQNMQRRKRTATSQLSLAMTLATKNGTVFTSYLQGRKPPI